MNWLMSSHPLVLGAWVIAIVGAVLCIIGRRGRLVSRAEFCRKCGHETMSGGSRCTECGARLGVSSLRLAFELNHPLLARLTAVTRRGRREPRSAMVAWGALALCIGLGIGAGVPALRLARIDWNQFRATPTLLAHAQSLRFDDPAYDRIIGVLSRRGDAGKLTAPQLAAYQKLVKARDDFKISQLIAQQADAAAQPIYAAYAPPLQAPRTLSVAASRAPDIDDHTVSLVDAMLAEVDSSERIVTGYQPPALLTPYSPNFASASPSASGGFTPTIKDPRSGAPLGGLPPFAGSQEHAPRISPATGLAPRGSLTQRPTAASAGAVPGLQTPTPPLGSPYGGTIPPGMVPTTTLNNPALAPSTLRNRPYTPSRISNTFGR